jgi:ABC-2 type transport system ATP-binding protein
LPGPDAPRLVAAGLVTGFRDGGAERVITRASFHAEPGTILAVIGPSGSGKTTLLRTLLGLLPPRAGVATFGGLPCDAYRARHGIGFLPEALALPGAWTPRGLLGLAVLTGGDGAAAAVDDAVRLAGIDFDLDLPLARLSKGMRQRVALALVLTPPPALLLLDEPEAGLDPAQRILLRRRLRELARGGRVIVVATHDVAGIAAVADRVLVLRHGAAVELAPADLAQPGRTLELFGYEEEAWTEA